MLWSKAIGAGGAGGVVEGWNVSTSVFVQSFRVTYENTPTGVFFKPDGTKMYIIGTSSVRVVEYNLSTAWDVSTASFVQRFFVGSQESSPRGLSFNSDGTKMYIIGPNSRAAHEYNLSTAWDVSTAVFLQSFSVAAQDTAPRGMFFKPDGLKMYVVGAIGDDVNEYNLSTAWDVSTASFVQRFYVGPQESIPYGVFFKPDGLKMYVVGENGDEVNEYNLSTAWNVSTASFVQNFSVAAQEIQPYGLFFKPDGTKMYIIGPVGDDVNEYDLTA